MPETPWEQADEHIFKINLRKIMLLTYIIQLVIFRVKSVVLKIQ